MTTRELSVPEALDHLRRACPVVAASDTVALAAAPGRVLATDVVSSVNLPPFDNSAMDGYAFRIDDAAAELVEIGRAYAGHAFAGALRPGSCVRVMTGAPLPAGADTVVPLEDVVTAGERIRLQRAPKPGANIRRRGEHVRVGDVVLAAGRWLGAADVALAAAVGVAQLHVLRPLRIALLSTGDELLDPPASLPPAATYDANRPLLAARLQRLGFEVYDLGICADAPEAFSEAIARAFDVSADALVISGGAAQGDADIVRQAGGVSFLPLNIRPGRGIALAQLQQADQSLMLLGLPGNAVAAYVMFELVARPTLLHMAGATVSPTPALRAPLAQAVQVRGGRIDYRRGRLRPDADYGVCVELLPDQGSAMLRTVVQADVLAAIGPEPTYAAGDWVEILPLAHERPG